MGIADFERRLERGVEGVFGRVFKSEVRPVEIGRKLVREMDLHRTVGVSGATVVPNFYRVELSESDYDQLADMADVLRRELVDLLREHANEERYRVPGPLEIEFNVRDGQRTGAVVVESKFRQPEPGAAIARILLPSGEHVPVAAEVITIGRQSDCSIVVVDPNVSRRHAELRPTPDGVLAVDLGSTNGTLVNGARISSQILRHGDQIVCGGTVLSFETD